MDSEPEVLTPTVVDDDEQNLAHIPIAENGKAYCSGVKDMNNPYSVWSVSHPSVKRALERTPDDLFLLDDNHLAKMAGADPRLRTLRMAFQREYERVILAAQRTGTLGVMKKSNIFGGIVSEQTFTRLVSRPECLAYMTMPVVDYHDSLKALSMAILQRYDEILHAPLYDKKGNFKSNIAEVVLKAIRAVEDRVWGQSVQRVSSESKSLMVSIPTPMRSVQKTTDMMLTLEARVNELQAELYGVRKLGEPGQIEAAPHQYATSPENWIAQKGANKDLDWGPDRLAKLQARQAKEGEVGNGESKPEGHSDETKASS
jgi:hypothetical protein